MKGKYEVDNTSALSRVLDETKAGTVIWRPRFGVWTVKAPQRGLWCRYHLLIGRDEVRAIIYQSTGETYRYLINVSKPRLDELMKEIVFGLNFKSN
jgi:hypothetical protein